MQRRIILVISSIITKITVKKSWDVINLVLNRKTHKTGCSTILSNDAKITNKTEISEAFNNYFTSVPIEIAGEIPRTNIDFKYYLQDYSYPDSFFTTDYSIWCQRINSLINVTMWWSSRKFLLRRSKFSLSWYRSHCQIYSIVV